MRYEREAKEWLSLSALGEPQLEYRDGPWLEFADQSGKRLCQPDALIACPAEQKLLIVEIKYQHTADAWFQLRQLYLPVLRCAMPGYTISLLEVVHWFDPQVAFPEEVKLVPTLEQCVRGTGDHSVRTLIFNRSRERRFQQTGHSGGKGTGQADGPIWPAQRTDDNAPDA